MLDEMIAKVKDAEHDADEIIRSAQAEANSLMEEAEKKAAYMIECAEKKADEAVAAAIINVKKEEEKSDKIFDAETEKISEQLRKNALRHSGSLEDKLREIMFA